MDPSQEVEAVAGESPGLPSSGWQARALTTFVDCVTAPVGFFPVLQRMTDAMHDPEGGDAERLLQILRRDPDSAAVLERRRLLRGLDLAALGSLPLGSLGRTYADHMRRNGLQPPPLPEHYHDLHPRHFVQRRLLDLHDVWHVATGFDTDPLGEIGIGAFNAGQLPTRFFTAMLAKNLAKVALEDVTLAGPGLGAVARGLELASRARPLFGYPWDERWAAPLREVQLELGLPS